MKWHGMSQLSGMSGEMTRVCSNLNKRYVKRDKKWCNIM